MEDRPLILRNKEYSKTSVFKPENLLREARRQKDLEHCEVPGLCVLDPDGDLVDFLRERGRATRNECWACYHSELYNFDVDGRSVGIIPNVVGAPYAVLVAEQLFVSGCSYLISVTSAGILHEPKGGQQFALITEALRDEGTSYHYMSPEERAVIPSAIYQRLNRRQAGIWSDSKSWTTDAPYRETDPAISNMKAEGVNCVEMEAAALYAFARVKERDLACFAHLTNEMAQEEGDFEKGEDQGSRVTVELISTVLQELEE